MEVCRVQSKLWKQEMHWPSLWGRTDALRSRRLISWRLWVRWGNRERMYKRALSVVLYQNWNIHRSPSRGILSWEKELRLYHKHEAAKDVKRPTISWLDVVPGKTGYVSLQWIWASKKVSSNASLSLSTHEGYLEAVLSWVVLIFLCPFFLPQIILLFVFAWASTGNGPHWWKIWCISWERFWRWKLFFAIFLSSSCNTRFSVNTCSIFSWEDSEPKLWYIVSLLLASIASSCSEGLTYFDDVISVLLNKRRNTTYQAFLVFR